MQYQEKVCEREVGAAVSGLIVRHNNRHLGTLDAGEARERLVSGSISFSEFVDQVGDDFRELLDFMTEHDLHPGRPGEVLYHIENHPLGSGRGTLRSQLRHLYALGSRRSHRSA
ncbi:MAG: hypothetical protein H0V53_02505 [Rubrobacter sp.]|nr:hypothetical protein [Rubrobacter sp.]